MDDLERDMEYFVQPEETLGTRGDASEQFQSADFRVQIGAAVFGPSPFFVWCTLAGRARE